MMGKGVTEKDSEPTWQLKYLLVYKVYLLVILHFSAAAM